MEALTGNSAVTLRLTAKHPRGFYGKIESSENKTDGTPYDVGRRSTSKARESNQEACSRRVRDRAWRRRARAYFRCLPPLGLFGSESRPARLVRTAEAS